MATTADFKNGMGIILNEEIFLILEFQHVKPGKGAAFVRTRLKNARTGKVFDHTFSAGERVTEARVVRRPYQFLYSDDLGYHFMDQETFEQVSLEEHLVNAPQFLKEGGEVEIVMHEESGKVLSCELPPFVHLAVDYTEPGMKGDTATRATKPATMETGAQVNVPLFIENEEVLKIDTRTGKYVERVKDK